MHSVFPSRLLLSLPLLLGLQNPSLSSELSLAGSTTVLPIARTIAQAYQEINPGVNVTVAGGGSAQGIKALIEGTVTIATSSRFLTTAEVNLATAQSIYLVPFRIAYDCIVPVVHVSNRVKDIALPDLKLIFTGAINNWRSLGGSDLMVKVVSRDSTSGTRKVWDSAVMGQQGLAADAGLRDSNDAVLEYVARDRGAIGYIGLGYLNATVKPLAVDGIMGSLKTARDGTYPIGRPLFLFTRGWPEGTALDFINFVLHPRGGQKLVHQTGYVPLY